MLNSLKDAGKSMGHELSRAWGNITEGWRELLSRSGNALTQFSSSSKTGIENKELLDALPRWGLLAGDIEEMGNEVVVRIEIPGMQKDDFEISIEGNVLQISGEKRYEGESVDSSYHMMECAYGMFRRNFLLPGNVDSSQAQASYRNGVLNIRLPKVSRAGGSKIMIT